VSARTKGGGEEIKPVRTFCGQGGGGQFFAILCGRLLRAAPDDTIIINRTEKVEFVYNIVLFAFSKVFLPANILNNSVQFYDMDIVLSLVIHCVMPNNAAEDCKSQSEAFLC